jgi:hypothetical protein
LGIIVFEEFEITLLNWEIGFGWIFKGGIGRGKIDCFNRFQVTNFPEYAGISGPSNFKELID